MRRNSTTTSVLLLSALVWLNFETASAAEIEPMNKAVMTLLGTSKAMKKTWNDGKSDVPVFYSKGASGKPEKVVFIEKGIYPPDCTHTWAIGLDAATGKVTGVRPIEMSCPHAFPTKASSFLDQFNGKGPADVQSLDKDVHVIAKATGTSQLAIDVVKRSITTLAKNKGQL